MCKKKVRRKDNTVDLEQHVFELHRSTYTLIFSINTCIVFDLRLGARGCRRPAVCIDLHHFIIGDLSIYGFLYLLGGPGTNAPCILIVVKFFWSQKLHADFLLYVVQCP